MKSIKPKIIVAIRKRPLTKKEIQRKRKDIIKIPSYYDLIVKEQRRKVDLTKYLQNHKFTFDAVFDESHDNNYIW